MVDGGVEAIKRFFDIIWNGLSNLLIPGTKITVTQYILGFLFCLFVIKLLGASIPISFGSSNKNKESNVKISDNRKNDEI